MPSWAQLVHFARHVLHWLGTLVNSTNLPQILSAVAWPLVVVFALYKFAPELKSLLGRILSASWGDKVIQFGEEKRTSKPGLLGRLLARISGKKTDISGPLPPDEPPNPAGTPIVPVPPPAAPVADVIDKSKIGDIYWVGADAMNGYDVLLRGGNRDQITHMLRQVNFHMKQTGMQGDPLQVRAERLFNDATKSLESDWIAAKRVSTANELASIVLAFGQRIEKFQPGFKGFPD